ncbi:glycoside hydrolase family 16 protein [Pseudoalteromonas byunsanensis]|nr:glycoside hydrolase family 16 protein [Pseudoalteromonas byunsanensis]
MNKFVLRNIHLVAISSVAMTLCVVTPTSASVGKLLWQDNFDSFNNEIWNVDIGDGCDQGICGWGNQELQWYHSDNVSITDIVGEPGNRGLLIEARKESIGGKGFSSGKVHSKNKVSIQYGMIETRMKVSSVDTGLWPAIWMLGTSTASWPAKGEIDIMEMGQSEQARTDAGFPNSDIDSYTGSNLIFYSDDACNSGNPTCAASVAWQTDNAHLSTTVLTDRFVTYRLYWTDTTIRFTVEDQGVEYSMFDQPFSISEESDEFNAPFYLLMNLAVGGNFTDAKMNHQVSAPLPGKMVVDYVRVYEYNGQGEVKVGNSTEPEQGTFGVYTDLTQTNNKLTVGVDSDIYVWNQNSLSLGNITPFEGEQVIAWDYRPNQWFGGGIQARQPTNMSEFADGELRFRIKIPKNVAFKVGISDTYSNENWLTFAANETRYGLTRDGDWAQAVVPIDELAGPLIALQSLKSHFSIASVDGQIPRAPFSMAIDDIIWTGGGVSTAPDSDNDGIADEVDLCPNTPANTQVDENGCAIVAGEFGISQLSTKSIRFYVNSNQWADVHYQINGGVQQNVRMNMNSGQNELVINGLNIGDEISYWFTYLKPNGAVDTKEQRFMISPATWM